MFQRQSYLSSKTGMSPAKKCSFSLVWRCCVAWGRIGMRALKVPATCAGKAAAVATRRDIVLECVPLSALPCPFRS